MAAREKKTERVAKERAADAYEAAAVGLRGCLELADAALQRGSAHQAARYLLGAIDDLGPELAALRAFVASAAKAK